MYKIDNRPKKHRGKYTVLGILTGIIITVVALYFYNNYQQSIINDIDGIKNTISSKISKQLIDSNAQKQLTLDELQQITLQDINNYRQINGVNSIIMDNAKASQLWAEHLLSEGCISHREGSNGPMQRYLNSGDRLQMVFENISGGYGTQYMDIVTAIKTANAEMMNNDQDQNNLHKYNILNPNHISVSLGIAYNSNKLILVEDFQEPYVDQDWKSFDMMYDDGKSCW